MERLLTRIINDLPIFDDTETGKLCLEDLANELALVYDAEATQEGLAELILNQVKGV